MASEPTLGELRAEFGRSRLLSMPIAGAIAWSAAGVFGAILPDADSASIALFLCMPAVFPLGLLISRFTGEDVFGAKGQKLAGLMWVPLSWMLQHWVGLFHAIARTVLVATAWLVFPDRRFVAVPMVIVVVYLISIAALASRPRPQVSPPPGG